MYILGINMWFTKLIKQFFFWVDKIVFNFISEIYDLMITIARTSPLSQADIAEMADRIYKLLAVFMIFKVTLSLITYIVNPDDFSDKSKGVSKLGANIVISLSLLVLTPYIFNYAFQLQTIILEDNSLFTLIFGEKSNNVNFFHKAGDEIAFTTISPFITPNLSIRKHDYIDLSDCVVLVDYTSKGDKMNSDCYEALEEILNEGYEKDLLENYKAGLEHHNLGLFLRQDLVLEVEDDTFSGDEFIMEYKFIFSTVVGVVVVLLLLTFCMDIAVRSIKLAFLQLIAPIPILSYIDPKSGKDGMFKKWYQMCFKTFLSLFIRLLALYFAIYIIHKVSSMRLVDVIDGSYVTNKYIAIFIIIGALMFAKQLPKILEGLGIKLDGDGKFTLNPLRKMEKEALGGGLLKKPNDMLGKFGKGIVKAPFTGAALGARKIVAGIDSASHGKGFINGTKNVKGKIAQAKDKFMEKNLPYTSKSLKEKKEGRDEVSLMHNKWVKGDKAAKRLGGDTSFKNLDGREESRDYYTKAGFSGEFLESKMKLDRETEKKKIYQRIYNARQMGTTVEKILEQEGKNMAAYGIKTEDISTDTVLSQKLDNQNKTVAGLEKVHESLRKTDRGQAELEDSIKFRKYNEKDPTNISESQQEPTQNAETQEDPTTGSESQQEPTQNAETQEDPTTGSESQQEPTQNAEPTEESTPSETVEIPTAVSKETTTENSTTTEGNDVLVDSYRSEEKSKNHKFLKINEIKDDKLRGKIKETTNKIYDLLSEKNSTTDDEKFNQLREQIKVSENELQELIKEAEKIENKKILRLNELKDNKLKNEIENLQEKIIYLEYEKNSTTDDEQNKKLTKQIELFKNELDDLMNEAVDKI